MSKSEGSGGDNYPPAVDTESEESEAPEGANPSVEDAVGEWTAYLAAAVQKHSERGLAARQRVKESGYDAAGMQKDMFEYGAQVWTDSLKSVMHLANIARASASDSR